METLQIGIQLYTLRAALHQDFKAVCRELVKLGCEGVEPAFYFGDMEPAELAAFFREIKLAVCGLHLNAQSFENPDDPVFDHIRHLRPPYLTFSRCDRDVTDYRPMLPETIRLCQVAGDVATRLGSEFTYHNHAGEFLPLPEGDCAYDRLMAACPPLGVRCELDVYWIQKAGQDPIAYIRKYADRLPQLHLKDMSPDDGGFTELGRGTVDLYGCVAAARQSACRWLIYEQDSCRGDAFAAAQVSLAHLQKLRAAR